MHFDVARLLSTSVNETYVTATTLFAGLKFIASAKAEVGYWILGLKYVRNLKWYLEHESEVLKWARIYKQASAISTDSLKRIETCR